MCKVVFPNSLYQNQHHLFTRIYIKQTDIIPFQLSTHICKLKELVREIIFFLI